VAESDEFTPAIPVDDAEARALLERVASACEALLVKPRVAPSSVGTGHWTATAANTLYQAALTGPMGGSWVRAIRTVTLSVSAAGLVVIGNSQIAPGGIAYGEFIRWKAAAAGTYTFDFGPEGLLPGAMGGNGQFLFWSDTAGLVIDITVVHN
jgi:hypothetical protein